MKGGRLTYDDVVIQYGVEAADYVWFCAWEPTGHYYPSYNAYMRRARNSNDKVKEARRVSAWRLKMTVRRKDVEAALFNDAERRLRDT